MQKYVTPSHPKAAIPDPAHGTDLPPEGRAVEWTAYWELMLLRGEISVADGDPSLSPMEGKGEEAAAPPEEEHPGA